MMMMISREHVVSDLQHAADAGFQCFLFIVTGNQDAQDKWKMDDFPHRILGPRDDER